METQAAGLRRRRLLGDLPLLPLAAVVDRLLPPTLHSRQRKAGVLFSVEYGRHGQRPKWQIAANSERAVWPVTGTLLLVQGRKTSGLHTLHCQNVLESTTATGNGSKGKNCILSSFSACVWLSVSVMVGNCHNYWCTSIKTG
jgi:hypothetical protein